MSTDLSTLFSFIGVRKNSGRNIAELETNFDLNNNGLIRLNASSDFTNANIRLSAGDGINLTWENITNSNVFITDGLVSINGDVMHLTVDDTNQTLNFSDANNNLFTVEPLDMGYITRLNSGVQHKVSDYSGDNNIEGSDYYIKYDLSSAPSILTLPAANISMGYTYIISDAFGYSSINSLTIQCTGFDTINGSSSYILDTDYQTVCLYSDGSSWTINSGAQGPQGIPGPSAVSTDSGNYSYLGTDSLVYTPKALQLIGQARGSVGITGTTAETQFTGIAIPIPANTFTTGDTFMIKSFYTVTGTAAAKTIQFRLGTSAAPSPVTSGISCMSLSVANTAGAFQISRDNNKLLTPTSILAMNPQGLNDVSSTSGVVVYSGIDFTTQLYLYPTVTLVNAADRVTFQKIALFKY